MVRLIRCRAISTDRFFQALLIVSTIGLGWLLMMAFHESGHVLHGWISGARLDAVHLPVIGFSRTDFAANPHPLFVAWGGAIWGCLLPLAIWGCAKHGPANRFAYLAAWFAGFCLVVNGAYLSGVAFLAGGADDGGAILRQGGTRWQLVAFGLPAIALGLWCWNGLGPCFGLGTSRGKVDRQAAVGAAIAFAAFACIELLLGTG